MTALEIMSQHDKCVKRWIVERKLKEIWEREEQVEDEVIVKLWICLIFTSFLMLDSNSGISIALLRFIDNLHNIHNYNWASYAYSIIMNSLDNLKSYCLGCT